MSYWVSKNSIGNSSKLHEGGFKNYGGNPSTSEFYEVEEAVILDVIYDVTYNTKNKLQSDPEIKNLVIENWPDNFKNIQATETDKDYTYVGRVLFRLLHSQVGLPKEKLTWAKPLHSTGIIEYPLLNEIVLVSKYRNEWYYFRKLNINGFINNNANFNVEKTEGNTSGNRQEDHTNVNKTIKVELGPISYTGPKQYTNANNRGVLGSYFWANNKIRTLKKFEGDTSIESRHGQSIRFAAYDSNRDNDKGIYTDYMSPDREINPNSGTLIGGGNPMILIRNRQRPLADDRTQKQLHPLLPPIKKIDDLNNQLEKNVGGIIEEDINNDGSSIHITSGLTISNWKPTVYKTIFCKDVAEEQSLYSPKNSTTFTKPTLDGDQIVINTDRLVLNSRFKETFHYSKKRYAVVTDSEYTVDAHDQIVITTNNKTVINSPAIYLGQYDQTNEPALLGQTTADWLYDLCEWLKAHTHWYKHTHPNSGGSNPEQTQLSVQIAQLEALQSRLQSLLSRRVFLTGGGFAPGANGVAPKNTDSNVTPTTINTISGEGVPGTFNGKNSRKLNK